MNSEFFEVKANENHTLIQVKVDKLDTSLAPILKSELVLIVGNGEKNILLDISNCVSCDSSGLSAILVANRLCKNSGGNFILFGLQESVEKLMEISQLGSVLNIVNNNEQALDLINEYNEADSTEEEVIIINKSFDDENSTEDNDANNESSDDESSDKMQTNTSK